jgi:ketosteroid isomerase-like protein
MSQENVEIVRESLTVTAYLAAIRDRDFRPLLVHFDPEVLVNQPPELPDAKSYRGHDGVVEALGDWPSQWDEFRADILEVIDGGETVVQLTRQYMRARDMEIEQDVAFVYTFKGGTIIGWDAYFTFDEALEAAGLRE